MTINHVPHCAACATDFPTATQFREHLDECRRNDPPDMRGPTSPVAQAHADAGPTEIAASRKASRFAGTLRGRVLAAVAAAGDLGLTVPEALEGLNLPERKRYSAAPRFSELVREGYVEKSAVSREGFAAYVATDVGRAWAAEGVAA